MKKILLFLLLGVAISSFAQAPCTPPVVTANPVRPFCSGQDIIVSVTVTGSGPFTYLWSNGETVSATSVTPDSTTTYTVTVKNSCGDSTVKSIILTPDIPNMTSCCNTAIGIGHSTNLVASGSRLVEYLWSPTVTCLNPICDSVRATPTVTTTYTVTGVDTLGCSVEELITITVGAAGILSISPNNIVNIYPNPSSTEFTLDLPTKALLSVSDITGRVLFSGMENAGAISFGKELSPGIYFIFIDGKLGGKVMKL